jgi:magnesium chelatase family protein
VPDADPAAVEAADEVPDLSDVRGHNALVPALEIVAAGGHNLFMHGPPGVRNLDCNRSDCPAVRG